MAQLTFDKKINLTTHRPNSQPLYADRLIIGNEPNNSIFQYYLKDYRVRDKEGAVVYTNYEDLEWENPAASITTQQVNNFGIKTFPGIGALGFYTPLVGNSKILVPVHIKRTSKYDAPVLLMVDNNGTLSFTITQPENISYTCFRIILEGTYNAFEYVTYDRECTIATPTVNDTYNVYCVGYVDEGAYTSENSNSFSLHITTGDDVLKPSWPEYASIEYVQQSIEYLKGLIDNT